MTSTESKNTWGFVSYSHADQALARWFTLEFRRLGVTCYFDERGLNAGDPLNDTIRQAILSAKALIVILTPSAVVSNWVLQELAWARESQKTVLAIELETVPENRLPEPVRDLLRIDASESLVKGLGKLVNSAPGFAGTLDALESHLSLVGATLGTVFELIGRVFDAVKAYRGERLFSVMPELKNCFLWRGTINTKGDELDLVVLEPPRDMPPVVPAGFEHARKLDNLLWTNINKLIDRLCEIAFGGILPSEESVEELFQGLKANLNTLDLCRALNLLLLRSELTGQLPKSVDSEVTRLRGTVNYCDEPPRSHHLKALLGTDNGIAPPTISVVVISHYDNAALPLCLEALCRQDQLPEEIILIEDGNPSSNVKPSIDIAFEHVVLPDNGLRGRRAACRAMGTRIAKGDIILYIDGDVLISPTVIGCVQELWQGMGFDLALSMMLPVAEGKNANETDYEQAMAAGNQDDAQLSLYAGRGVLRSWVESSSGGRASAGDLAWDDIRSRVWAVPRAEVLAAGNWDASFVGYGEEEIDLALRLERKCGTIFRIIRRQHCFGVHCEHPLDTDQDEQLVINAARLIRKHPDIRERRLRFFEGQGLRARIEAAISNDDHNNYR